MHKITTLKGALCTFESAFLVNHAGVVIQAYSSPSVDQFSNNSSPFIGKRKSNEHFPSVDFDFTLLILPAPIFLSVYLPYTLPKGLRAWRECAVSREKRGKALNAWEWLEMHSKLMGDKDNVLLIFCPITLWLMCWCWGTLAGVVPAHFTWWNRPFFCQNNLGQICVCCNSYSRGISHFIITLLSRFQLMSELDGPSLYRRCVFNMFWLQLVITRVTDGELYETDFLVHAYLEHTLLSSWIIYCQEKNKDL